jgi:aminopeptidase N
MKLAIQKFSKRFVVLIVAIVTVSVSFVHSQSSRNNWYSDYDITSYALDISVTDTSKFISGEVTIAAFITKAGLDSFYCELIHELTVDSVFINSAKTTFIRDIDLVKISLKKTFTTGEKVTVIIYYQGTVPKNQFFSSFAQKTDINWNIPVAWTLSEPFGAKQWFPCKQYLPDKADSAQIKITVPDYCKAGSNGILIRTLPVGTNKTLYEWKTTYPIAYYLLSFTVANYTDYSFYAKIGETDSVLVQNFIYNKPGFLDANKSIINATGDMITCFSKIFGEYPFKKEKYGHCVAPIGGGMEHQTMTTLSNFNYNLVSHELAHQWFGDMVTCDNWQDIWVNEGFASYAEYLAIDSLKSHDEALAWMENAHNLAYLSNGSVFVPESDKNNEQRIFNYNLTYKKGASIIHMLRYELDNDPLFFSILHTFLTRFAHKTATANDFISVVNDLSGNDFTWFFNQWYYGTGYPVYDISWKQTTDSVFLTSVQTPSVNTSGLFTMHFDVKFNFSDGDTTVSILQDAANKKFAFAMDKNVTDIRVNPEVTSLMKISNISIVPEIPSFDGFLHVAPNPFTNAFKIFFSSGLEEDISIKIVDICGKEITSKHGKKRSEIRIDTSDLLPGVYLLYVKYNNEKYIRKLIKAAP